MNCSLHIRLSRTNEALGTLLLAGLALGFCPVWPVSAQSPKVPTIADIVSDVKHQWEQVKSLLVEYEVTVEAPGGAVNAKRYLGADILGQEKVMFAFKENKRYYRQLTPPTAPRLAPDVEPDYDAIIGGKQMKESFEQTKARTIATSGKEKAQAMLHSKDPVQRPGHFEVAFDGTVLRRKNPGTLFGVHRVDDLEADDRWLKQDYLYRVNHPAPDPLKMDNRHASNRLVDFLANGHFAVQPQREDVERASCIVVTGPSGLWLDPKLGYAERKSENWHPGTKLLFDRTFHHDFKQVLPGLWLPQMIQWELCGPPKAPPGVRGQPLLRYTYKVTRLSANDVPDSLFRLEPQPGWTVWDGTVLPKKDGKDQYIEYVMPANPAQVDAAIKAATARAEARASREWRRSWGHRGRIVLFFALSAVLVLLWYIRRKRSLRKAGE